MMFFRYIKKEILCCALISFCTMAAQPYTEILGFNVQTFSAPYQNNGSIRNSTQVYALNALLPHQLKNGNAVLLRFNAESIHATTGSNQYESSTVSGISVGLGFQWVSENRKYKTSLFAIPKLASDFKQSVRNEDWQYGLLLLENYKLNPKLQFRAGMYYNKEAFGVFFVPLLGVDWKATERISLYGILPSNYKIEYEVSKKCYTGISFRSMTRSFRLSEKQNNDYVRFDETVLRYFTEYYFAKNLVLTGEAGYSFGKNPRQYKSGTDIISNPYLVNGPTAKYVLFLIGVSYRIRK